MFKELTFTPQSELQSSLAGLPSPVQPAAVVDGVADRAQLLGSCAPGRFCLRIIDREREWREWKRGKKGEF